MKFQIEDIDLPFDKVKNQRRAFCFITFESEEIVNEACQMSKQTIHGKEVCLITIYLIYM